MHIRVHTWLETQGGGGSQSQGRIHTETGTATNVHRRCGWSAGSAHFTAPVQTRAVCPRGALLPHLTAAQKQHLFMKRIHISLILTRLLFINVWSAAADAGACLSSIRGKHGSAESRSRAGRGYWTEQRRVKAAATDHDLFLKDYITWGIPNCNFSDLHFEFHSALWGTQKLQHGITKTGAGPSVSVLRQTAWFLLLCRYSRSAPSQTGFVAWLQSPATCEGWNDCIKAM